MYCRSTKKKITINNTFIWKRHYAAFNKEKIRRLTYAFCINCVWNDGFWPFPCIYPKISLFGIYLENKLTLLKQYNVFLMNASIRKMQINQKGNNRLLSKLLILFYYTKNNTGDHILNKNQMRALTKTINISIPQYNLSIKCDIWLV